MGQPIPVWVSICVWAIPYTYGTAHTRMGKNTHMVRNTFTTKKHYLIICDTERHIPIVQISIICAPPCICSGANMDDSFQYALHVSHMKQMYALQYHTWLDTFFRSAWDLFIYKVTPLVEVDLYTCIVILYCLTLSYCSSACIYATVPIL